MLIKRFNTINILSQMAYSFNYILIKALAWYFYKYWQDINLYGNGNATNSPVNLETKEYFRRLAPNHINTWSSMIKGVGFWCTHSQIKQCSWRQSLEIHPHILEIIFQQQCQSNSVGKEWLSTTNGGTDIYKEKKNVSHLKQKN